MRDTVEGLKSVLSDGGYKGSVVSTKHLPALAEDLSVPLERGEIDRAFYEEIVSRSGLRWSFSPPTCPFHPCSIIVAAAPQPKLLISFQLPQGERSLVIPPTYTYNTDDDIDRVLGRYLSPFGYATTPAILPKKLLSVHAGLAAYGRNNVTYIDGWGSYFRLTVFFSDMPCSTDHWDELRMMKRCESCWACLKRCPTGAISDERFLIDGRRCLTFLNEGRSDFPDWVDPTWHNCLVGCMVCQDVCPENRLFSGWAISHTSFSETETQEVLRSQSEHAMRSTTREKVRQLPGFDDFASFQRNLHAVLRF